MNASIKNLGIENASVISSANDVAILAGNAQGGTISKCYVTGKTEGGGAVSGILGSTHSSTYPTAIDNCYARVAIIQNGGSTQDLAGISGWNAKTSLKLTNCFSACIGEKRPIAGWSDGSAVPNSQFENTYFDKTLSPNFSTASGRADLGKTSEELKQQSTYSGWDFENTWVLDPEVNGGYPYLRGFSPGLLGAPGSIAITLKDTNSGEPVTNAAVTAKNSENETEIPLNHQGNGVYSGSVNSTDGTYDIYVNDEMKREGVTLDDDSGTAKWEVAIGADTEKQFDGSGTKEDPYQIKDRDDLEELSYLVNHTGNSFENSYFVIPKDEEAKNQKIQLQIDAENPWEPIGTKTHPFKGTFNGNGIYVNIVYRVDTAGDNQGLFGVNAGTLKNVTVEGRVIGKDYVGSIAGINTEEGMIQGCDTWADVTGENYVGGFVGKNEGTVEQDVVRGGGVTGSGKCVGGIAGINNGTVSGAITYGSKVNGLDCVGGIVGVNTGEVVDGYNDEPVTGKDDVGGIVGRNESGGTVKKCINIENVSLTEDGTGKLGAIIGNNQNMSPNTTPDVVEDDYYMTTQWINKDLTGIGGVTPNPSGITCGPERYPTQNPDNPDTPEHPFEGSGTKDDPYQIGSKDDLENLRDLVNGGEGYDGIHFKVTADIDLGGEANPWTPIGTEEHPFKGTFDGGNHKVSGLYVNDETKDNQGLFGVNEGIIKNLTVAGSVEGNGNVGGIAGTNKGTIENCVNEAGITGNDNVGGIAGKNEGTIKDCANKGKIHGGDNAGGIAGSNTGTVSGSDNSGAVSGNDNVGGIAGNNAGTVNDSDNSGSVTGNGTEAGGIAGNNDGALKNDTNTAPVTGKDDIGGIAGTNGENGTVEGCTNSGNVTVAEDGSGTPGAVIGNNKNTNPDALKDDYYQKTNGINSGITGIGEGTGAGKDPEGITSGQTPANPSKDIAAAKSFEEKAAAIGKAAPVGGTKWKQAVKDARKAYDNLTQTQKNLASKTAKDMLTDAEAILAAVEKIEKIGTVTNTAACAQKIKDAKGAYDKLTSAQKAKIPANIKKILTDAETAYAKLTAGSGATDKERQEERAQILKLLKQLGVSEAAAAKIQTLVKELGIPAETLLLSDSSFTGQDTEGDMKGSSFTLLQAKASKVTEKSAKLTWKKVKGADGYQIYGTPCGKGNKAKLLTTIKTSGKTSYTQKKLKKGKAYRYTVRAYKEFDGKKITIAASKSVHIFTKGGKYGNAKSVKLKNVKKSSVSIKKGKKFKIKASEAKEKKPLKRHRVLSYESSDTKVATVTSKGVIKAKAKGKCAVYVYAQNGVAKSIKVTVK